jgi:hypothetical protein
MVLLVSQLLDATPPLHDQLELAPFCPGVLASQRNHLGARLPDGLPLGDVFADVVIAGDDQPPFGGDYREPVRVQRGCRCD